MLTAPEVSLEELLEGKSHKTFMKLCCPNPNLDLAETYAESHEESNRNHRRNYTERVFADRFEKHLEELKNNDFIDFALREYPGQTNPTETDTIELLHEYLEHKRTECIREKNLAKQEELQERFELLQSYC